MIYSLEIAVQRRFVSIEKKVGGSKIISLVNIHLRIFTKVQEIEQCTMISIRFFLLSARKESIFRF